MVENGCADELNLFRGELPCALKGLAEVYVILVMRAEKKSLNEALRSEATFKNLLGLEAVPIVLLSRINGQDKLPSEFNLD